MKIGTTSQGNQQLRREAAAFRDFTVSQWYAWFRSFFRYEIDHRSSVPYAPEISVGPRELHFALITLFRNLENLEDRDRFSEALAIVFENTPLIDLNAALIKHLLHVMAVAKSLLSKRLLRRTLFDRVLPSLHHNDESLDALLLSAVGEFDVDEKLIDFLYRSSDHTEDYSYLLTVFRLLATSADDSAYEFIRRIIPNIKSDADSLNLALEIKAEFVRVGYRPFCEWYCNNAIELGAEYPEKFQLFEYAMARIIMSLAEDIFFAAESLLKSESNVYLKILWHQFVSGTHSITAEDLRELASLYRKVGKDMVVATLSNLRRRGVKWSYVSEYAYMTANYYGATIINPTVRTIELEKEDDQIDTATFDSQFEPELDEIFERVKTYYVFNDQNSLV